MFHNQQISTKKTENLQNDEIVCILHVPRGKIFYVIAPFIISIAHLPAVNGDADRARNENVMESPLTSPRYLGYTELLMRISAADQQMGYIIRFGTRTNTNVSQR